MIQSWDMLTKMISTLATTFFGGIVELQTSPESGFVQITVCHRFTATGVLSLRGAILKRVTATGSVEEEITTLPHYRSLLQKNFGLAPTLADTLWESVWARHQRFTFDGRH